MNTSAKSVSPVKKHRRDVWLQIIAPVAIPFAGLIVFCMALIVAVAADSLIGKQVTIIMSCVATAFVFLPLTLLCIVPYAFFALGAVGAGKAYAHAVGPLRFVRRLTHRLALQTKQHAPKLARPLIGLNTRITRWEYRLKGWQQAQLAQGKEKHHE